MELEATREHAYALIVADGMGGEAFGELASSLALKTAWEWGSLATSWVMRMNPREAEEVQRRARVFINSIHRAIKRRAETDPELSGMGTTLTLAYTMGLDAVIIHVGDSRAYLLRGGGIQRLTHDHTLAQELADMGVPKEEAVAFRHVLTNSLGAKADDVTTEAHVLRLADGDRLLLCSDGLSDLVTDLEMVQTAVRWPHPQDACHALVDQALDRGGKDNVTVVMAHYAVVQNSGR
jgi:protein phosphatase